MLSSSTSSSFLPPISFYSTPLSSDFIFKPLFNALIPNFPVISSFFSIFIWYILRKLQLSTFSDLINLLYQISLSLILKVLSSCFTTRLEDLLLMFSAHHYHLPLIHIQIISSIKTIATNQLFLQSKLTTSSPQQLHRQLTRFCLKFPLKID